MDLRLNRILVYVYVVS